MSACFLQSPDVPRADLSSKTANQLTTRQHDVVRLLGEGLSNKRIAKALDLSESTVKHHIKSILEQLGASNRLQIVIYAYRSGIQSHGPEGAKPAAGQ